MIRAFDEVFDAPEKFDFFDALRRLESARAGRPRVGENRALREEIVRLGQDPFFAFPSANVSKADPDVHGVPRLLVRFLGLTGPQGPMPLTLTEEAYVYAREGDDALARFLDLFNNRFLQLFFRAWANARGSADRDRPAEARFDGYAGAPVGVGSSAVARRGGVPDALKVAYAGLLGPSTRSVSRLRDFLGGALGVAVEIVEFVPARTAIEPDERTRIGAAFAELGAGALLGAAVLNLQDKIRIVLHAPSLARYRDFLPGGALARAVADMVSFYLGPEIEWDVELSLPVGEVQPARLGVSGQLGWTSWMSPNWAVEPGARRRDARFDLSSLATRG